jgi:putative ABC transport system permease protein
MARVVLRGFMARKLRGALTAIAIVLGVALMAGTYILTDTINSSFATIFSTANAHRDVVVTPSEPFGSDAAVQIKPIPASALAAVRGVTGVAAADGSVFTTASLITATGKRLDTHAPAFIASLDTGRFQNFSAVVGHFPARDGELAIDQATAQRFHLQVGQSLRVAGQSTTLPFTIVGILKFAGSGSFGGASIAVVTLPQARTVAGEANSFNEIDVAAASGTSSATLRARIRAVLPSSLSVRTGTQQAAHQTSDLESQLGFLRTFLLIFAYVALFVGAFIIFNTFSITVAQRTREFGLLRALGATRRQLVRAVIAEGFLLGIGGSLLGLLAGIAVAPGLDVLFKAFGADLPDSGTVLELRTVIVSVLAGTIITVIAGLLPALRAARVPPIAALREGVSLAAYTERRPAARYIFVFIGVLILLRVVVGLAFGTGPTVLVLLVGFAVLRRIPPVRRRIKAWMRRPTGHSRIVAAWTAFVVLLLKIVSLLVIWRGVTGRLARENTIRQPGRTVATAAALMIGLGLVSFSSILAAGFKASIDQAINSSFAGNLIVENSNSTSNEGIPASIPTALRSVPGVRGVTAIAFSEAKLRGSSSTQSVTAVEPANFASVYRINWDQGSNATLLALGTTGTVLTKSFADSNNYHVGDRISVLTPSGGRIVLTVRGIATDNAKLLGDFTISLALARGPFAQATDALDFVSYAPGASNSTVQPEVNRLLDSRYPQARSQTAAQFKASEAGQVNQLLALISVLLALSIIVSLFGIVNTLVLSIFERTRELGMLRAIGTSRRQIRQMVRYESIVIALIGGVFGIVVGIVAALVIAATALSGGGFVFAVPVGTLVILFLLAGIAGVIAAAWPARRAARINILEALATQ